MDQVTEDAPAVDAGLEALAAQAQALDTGADPRPDPAAVAARAAESSAQAAAELLSALTMLRMMVAPGMRWWADFGQVWSDGTLKGIADAGAAVMEKHGWTMGELFSQWGPYIALAGAVLPPSLVTWQALKERREGPPRERPEPAAD